MTLFKKLKITFIHTNVLNWHYVPFSFSQVWGFKQLLSSLCRQDLHTQGEGNSWSRRQQSGIFLWNGLQDFVLLGVLLEEASQLSPSFYLVGRQWSNKANFSMVHHNPSCGDAPYLCVTEGTRKVTNVDETWNFDVNFRFLMICLIWWISSAAVSS